jgi:hypothetical protein
MGTTMQRVDKAKTSIISGTMSRINSMTQITSTTRTNRTTQLNQKPILCRTQRRHQRRRHPHPTPTRQTPPKIHQLMSQPLKSRPGRERRLWRIQFSVMMETWRLLLLAWRRKGAVLISILVTILLARTRLGRLTSIEGTESSTSLKICSSVGILDYSFHQFPRNRRPIINRRYLWRKEDTFWASSCVKSVTLSI